MCIARAILCATAAAWLAVPAAAEERVELHRVRLVNEAGGEIAVSRDRGATWERVGAVVRFTERVNPRGFTASKWAPPGRVAATAVNAIHITVGHNPEEDAGIVFSLLPRELSSPPAGYASFLSPDSSIHTDIPAGAAIFGGGDAPFVGSSVFVGCGESISPAADGYTPARGDVLTIVVERPARPPVAAVLDNWAGGAVSLLYPGGEREVVAWVVKPVRGIGRFAGSLYAGIGRLRANHPGVVDISTSPLGYLGGFQIIPLAHSFSPEMRMAWERTQWMIVAPAGPAADGEGSTGGGLRGLFHGLFRPDYSPSDLQGARWRRRLLQRLLVDVETDEWRPMPALRLSPDPRMPLPEWAHTALQGVRRIRILCPLEEEPGGGAREGGGPPAAGQ